MIHDVAEKQKEFQKILDLLKTHIDNDDLGMCVVILADKKYHYKVIYQRDGATLFEVLGALDFAKDTIKARG